MKTQHTAEELRKAGYWYDEKTATWYRLAGRRGTLKALR